MKKIFAFLFLLMFINTTCFAFSTTILQQNLGDKGVVPCVDGMQNLSMQKGVNYLLKNAGEKLLTQVGGKGKLSYEVTLNKPTVFSVILKAAGNTTAYKGVNIDVASGREVELKDFFYLKEGFKKLVPSEDVVFTDNGLLQFNGTTYSNKVLYNQLLPYVNIAAGARILPSYKLTEEANDKTMEVKQGEMIALYLESNPTTGYDWIMPESIKNKQGIVYMGDSFMLPANSRRKDVVGAPGIKIFVLTFNQPGTYKVGLEYKRSWVQGSSRKVDINFVVK